MYIVHKELLFLSFYLKMQQHLPSVVIRTYILQNCHTTYVYNKKLYTVINFV